MLDVETLGQEEVHYRPETYFSVAADYDDSSSIEEHVLGPRISSKR